MKAYTKKTNPNTEGRVQKDWSQRVCCCQCKTTDMQQPRLWSTNVLTASGLYHQCFDVYAKKSTHERKITNMSGNDTYTFDSLRVKQGAKTQRQTMFGRKHYFPEKDCTMPIHDREASKMESCIFKHCLQVDVSACSRYSNVSCIVRSMATCAFFCPYGWSAELGLSLW